MGVSNIHSEPWGDFGMGWQQIGTSVLMTSPSTATILAQATPWSPATAGEVIAIPALKEEKDFDAWRGKLAGKIVLYGSAFTTRLSAMPCFPATPLPRPEMREQLTKPLEGIYPMAVKK